MKKIKINIFDITSDSTFYNNNERQYILIEGTYVHVTSDRFKKETN